MRIQSKNFLNSIRSAVENRKFFRSKPSSEQKRLFDKKIFDHKELSFKVRKALVVLQKGLAQEQQETKQMLATYHKYTRGEATEEEMQEANQQFRDVIKGLGLSVVVILPFSPITLPAIVKLGQKFGIQVLPSAFREQYDLENGAQALQIQADKTVVIEPELVATSESSESSATKPRD